MTQRIRCVQLPVVIPEFLATGILPVGIHWATLAEVSHRFGVNSHRERLLNGFCRAIAALEAAGCKAVYLDGSFVTDKPTPSDFDACWEMTGVSIPLLDKVFLDFTNMRAAQKAKYCGEFFPTIAVAQSTPHFRTFLEFFQTDKNTGDDKGIIGIRLN